MAKGRHKHRCNNLPLSLGTHRTSEDDNEKTGATDGARAQQMCTCDDSPPNANGSATIVEANAGTAKSGDDGVDEELPNAGSTKACALKSR